MSSLSNPGRVAGFWYLALVLIGPLRLMYIPAKLIVHDNAAATAANLTSHELLFRSGMAADAIGGVVLVFLGMALYRLFREVDPLLAALVVMLGGVMPGLLYLVNVAADEGALTVARNAAFLSAFAAPQREALAMLFLRLHDHLTTAAEILWGVWLFPLGALVRRSRFMPRLLGIWLILNGAGWAAMSLTGLLVPPLQSQVYLYGQPLFFAEIAFMLWLIVRGARPGQVPMPAATGAAAQNL